MSRMPEEGPATGTPRPSRSVVVTGVLLIALGTVPVLVPLLATQEPQSTRAPVPSGSPGSTAPSGGPPTPRPGAAADGMTAGASSPARTPARTSSTSPAVPTRTATATPTATPMPIPTATVPADPDLVVTGVAWVPTDPRAGQTVTFRASVRNAGTEPAPAGDPSILFRVDGVTVSWSRSDTSPLQPGEQRTYTADGGPTTSTWLVTKGRHTVTAAVDSDGRIRETTEDNNVGTAALIVPGGPNR